jgi:hypothetical protein
MGMAKRQLQEHEDRLALVEAICIKMDALVYDEVADETSSAEESEADKHTYASVFKAWAAGKVSGTAEEVFEAVKSLLESYRSRLTIIVIPEAAKRSLRWP